MVELNYVFNDMADTARYIWSAFTGGGKQPAAENPYAALTRYLIEEWEQKEALREATGGTIIKGVALPELVVNQLRRHGFNPEWCNPYELEAARQSAIIDDEVFDDPDGNNFFDELDLSEEEKEEENNRIDPPPYRTHFRVRPNAEHAPAHDSGLPGASFCDTEKRRRMQRLSRPDDDACPHLVTSA